jgi:hypothetical protein
MRWQPARVGGCKSVGVPPVGGQKSNMNKIHNPGKNIRRFFPNAEEKGQQRCDMPPPLNQCWIILTI